jgi:hypothetical protein
MPLSARILFPIFGAAFLTMAAITPPGFFSIDELIYHAAAVSVALDGSLTVSNGYQTFGSPDLRVAFLVEGPNGLAPQYPPGSALLGAPFVAVLGVRGLMVLNALAAFGVLWFTWVAARAMFPARRIAVIALALTGGASFLPEYAAGVWPHALSAFFVTGAVAFAARALALEERGSLNLAIASGFMVGAGLLFRVDTVLILPAILALAVLYAPRPASMILGGALGMTPGLALAAWLNLRKFGTPNPISYGSDGSGGGIDMTSYLPLAGVGLLGLAALVAVRMVPWTPARRWGLAIMGLAVVAVAMTVGPARAPAMAYFSGAYALIVDLTGLPRYSAGIVEPMPGVVYFWGAVKKSLGGSLPWISALVAIPALLIMRRDRATSVERGWILFLLLAVLIWTAPFFLRSWHGGLSSNLRYLLPVVPLLAILTAWVWDRLRRWGGLSTLTLAALVLFGIGSVFFYASSHPAGMAAAQQVWTKPVLAVAAGLVLAASLAGGRWGLGRLAEAGLTFGAGLAIVFGWLLDPGFAVSRRATTAAVQAELATAPGPVLFYGPPEFLAQDFRDPERLVAIHPWGTAEIDGDLIRDAAGAGYRVYLQELFADRLEAQDDRFERTGRTLGTDRFILVEMAPAPL